MRKCIIVLGPGRCGSSAVAGALCDLGVYMCSHVEKDDANPDGYYEDTQFKDLHKKCMSGKISLYKWYKWAKYLIEDRSFKHEMWGFKDPRTCYFIQHYLTMIEEPILIRVKRVREDIVGSMQRCYGWTYRDAYKTMIERENLIEPLPTKNIQIETDNIKEELSKWL